MDFDKVMVFILIIGGVAAVTYFAFLVIGIILMVKLLVS